MTLSHKSPQELVDLYKDVGVASKVLTRYEGVVCSKLVEVGKAFLWAKARSLVTRAAGKAILYPYGSDGTPLLARSTTVTSLGDGSRRVRKAGHAVEFLMQKAFLTFRSHSGEKSRSNACSGIRSISAQGNLHGIPSVQLANSSLC